MSASESVELLRLLEADGIDVDDCHDVAALCERSSIALRAEFSRFVTF